MANGSLKRVINDNGDWAQLEFENVDLGDKRLQKRLIKIAQDFTKQPNASIPKSSGNWADTKASHRFFSNYRVSDKAMLSSHLKATIDRISEQKVVLAVQDTTSLNYTSHPETEGLGTIGGSQETTIGIMVHDTMAFTPAGVALGLIGLQTWTRPQEEFGKKRTCDKRPIDEKESYKWLESFEATKAVQAEVPGTILVNIGDRESDIYELFELATSDDKNPKLLIRAHHNRWVDHPEKYLWDFMASQKIRGTYTIKVPCKKNRSEREAVLAIRFAEVTLKRPKNASNPQTAKFVTVWAVLAEENNPPPEVEPISWLLLTTIPIYALEEAIEKVNWYMIRWQIELFHKVLKSGCRVEDHQLQSVEKLKRCLVIDAVVAWRILLLTKLGREVPDLPCTCVFEEYEWKALYCFVHKTPELPEKEPKLQEIIHMVAKLGGFLGRKNDGEPGSIILWCGLHRFNDIAAAWFIFNPQSNGIPKILMGKG